MKVATITARNILDLERKVNDFIDSNKKHIAVQDVKFTAVSPPTGYHDTEWGVLVIYEPLVEGEK